MFSLLKSLFGKRHAEAALQAPRGRPQSRVRLGLEVLEDRLALSFMVQGDLLLVTGTGGSDTLSFTAGTIPQVQLNGASYTVNPKVIHTISYDGVGGNDSATLTDTTGFANAVTLTAGGGKLVGSNYTFTLTNTPNIEVYGSASGSASLSGSSAVTNTFVDTTTWTGSASAGVSGSNYGCYVFGFGKVSATAGTSADEADLFGSLGIANKFIASPASAVLSSSAHSAQALGFHTVHATSGLPTDIADLTGGTFSGRGGSGINTFVGTPTSGEMYGSSGIASFNAKPPTYDIVASNFSMISAHAGTSADAAYLSGASNNGSSRNNFDLLDSWASMWNGVFTGTVNGGPGQWYGQTYDTTAIGFGNVHAWAAGPGDDASLTGTVSGKNTFVDHVDFATMSGSNYSCDVHGFAVVTGISRSPLDEASLYGSTTSTNEFSNYIYAGEDSMQSNTHSTYAQGFGIVNAYAGTAADVASLQGAFVKQPGPGVTDVGGDNYIISAFGFSLVQFTLI